MKAARAPRDPVPKKLRDSKEVKKWLASQKEFKLTDFADHVTEFFERLHSNKNTQLLEMYLAVRLRLKKSDRKLFDMYLEQNLPAREISAYQRRPIDRVYRHIKYGKQRIKRAYDKYKEELANAPRRKPLEPTLPLRVLHFHAPGKGQRTARLVLDRGVPMWVDDAGGIFDEETQELLENLAEVEREFQVIDVESR